MNNLLNAFLNQGKQNTKPINELEKEVIVSKRFSDDKGKPLKWKIRAMDNERYDMLIEKYKKSVIVKEEITEKFDRVGWQSELLVESVVDPNLKDASLCQMYGTLDSKELIRKMLLPGEYLNLVKEVMKINGFYDDYSDDAQLQIAKNLSEAPKMSKQD